ncbi:hypothetical protein OH460_04585 [Vibrio sp. Makdt]|uniref:hypothetical protein n=1 Tax=Vibrio sp. Makdt TaxID=2998828 RepID=UPI0022CD27D6|nr:hypothetical protein [Vibrio sp. Makdt]MDA0151579.1 hypothetical protein [Vibrio sp. Makdt]
MSQSTTINMIESADKMLNVDVSEHVYQYIESRLVEGGITIEQGVNIARMACILGLNHNDDFDERYKDLFNIASSD